MRPAMPFREARDRLAALSRPVGTERIPLSACANRVLAQDLVASSDVPPFDRSPYDGYVLRARDSLGASRDAPVTLRILEEICASCVPRRALTAGTASKILTGAPIPEGGDAVVPFEDTRFTESEVTIFAPMRPGENIVCAGEDIRRGALLCHGGQRVDAGVMGALAGQNIVEPLVYRQPRVGILSTGSELVEPGRDLAPGRIRDTNRYSMAAAVSRLGAEPILCAGAVHDQVEQIAASMECALADCDALITTGGVSVGDYDLTPAAMEAIGTEILFRKVDLKPGMACAYGLRGGKMVCGLSGNPVSSIKNFYAVALPAFRRLCGLRDFETQEISVTLDEPFAKHSPVNRLLLGYSDLRDGTVRLRLSERQGNMMISGLVGCDLAAVIPAGSGPVGVGTVLKGFFLDA